MTNARLRGCASIALAVFLLVVGLEFAWAQVTGTISGRVEDATGAAVGGATVTVKSLETRATRAVTTDETGDFRALSLLVGLQELQAEKAGFKSTVRTGISLAVGR